LKRFILNEKPDKNGAVKLKGSDYHYLVRVRRLAVGEFFPALLPDDTETQVQIISVDNNILKGKCAHPSSLDPNSSLNSAPREPKVRRLCERYSPIIPPIILFQALPKADKMDLIVRQAAEGGITEIVPFVSEFSVAKANISAQKITRWEKIIKEAKQQSGSKIATSLRLPVSDKCFSIKEIFDYWDNLKKENAFGLIFHHQGLEQDSLHEYLNNNPKIVVLVIGPEGGFSDKEVSLFLDNGFKSFTIGDTVLRTETAALYCAAAIRILLLEKNSWTLKQI